MKRIAIIGGSRLENPDILEDAGCGDIETVISGIQRMNLLFVFRVVQPEPSFRIFSG